MTTPTAATPTMDAAFRNMAAHLHRGAPYAYLWAKLPSGRKQTFWFETGQPLPPIPQEWAGADFYYGVHPTTARGTQYSRAKLGDIGAINCLFAEYDDKDWANGRSDINQHIAALDAPPSALVASGAGVHAYWLLRDTVTVTDANREELRDIQKGWNASVGGSVGVNDLARVLRIAGTVNHKYTPPLPVELIYCDLTELYDFTHLCGLLPPPQQQAPAAATTTPARPAQAPGTLHESDWELLEVGRQIYKAEFIGLFDNGDIGAVVKGDKSRSGADFALYEKLSFLTDNDRARAHALYRGSALFDAERIARKGASYLDDTFVEAMVANGGNTLSAHRARKAAKNQAAIDAAQSAVGSTSPAQPTPQAAAPQAGQAGPGTPPPSQAKGRAPTKAERAYALAAANVRELFTSSAGDAWAVVNLAGHVQAIPLASMSARGWLQRAFFDVFGAELASSEAIQTALDLLSFDAHASGVTRPVYIRVANLGDRVYLDLGDPDWTAVEIDAAGWRLVQAAPVAFRRPRSMRPLPIPTQGHLTDLFPFLNIKPESAPLILSWAVAAMAGVRPMPILAPAGAPGLGKSTLSKVLKRLIDPAETEVRSAPREPVQVAVAAANGWLLAFDNLSRIDAELSDLLCQAATGSVYAGRALYSNYDEAAQDVSRPVLLNSVGDVISRPDLLDRAIPIELAKLPDDRREAESIFWARYAVALPGILAGLLDAVSAGLRNLETVKLDRLPRMADFARFAAAAELDGHFGTAPGAFLAAYEGCRQRAVVTLAESSLIGEPLREMLSGLAAVNTPTTPNLPWRGTSAQLLRSLEKQITAQNQHRHWPQSARALTTILRSEGASLAAAGIATLTERENRNHVLEWEIDIMR
jgi:hypothetical protein